MALVLEGVAVMDAINRGPANESQKGKALSFPFYFDPFDSTVHVLGQRKERGLLRQAQDTEFTEVQGQT